MPAAVNARPPRGPLARPAALLPILLAGALLAFAFKLGDLGIVLGRVRVIPTRILLTALAMAIVYLVLKGWQLRLLLANLGLHPDWRRFALAYAVGELMVTLPLGIFAQNWILSSTGSSRFGTSSAATVLMLAVETLVVLIVLAVFGVPHWPVVRPLAIAFSAGIVLTGYAVVRFEHVARQWAHKAHVPILRDALASAIQLLYSLKRLSSWRIVGLNVVLAAAYLGVLAIAFTAIGGGVGLRSLDYVTAASIYALSLAVVLMCGGLVSQIGTIEVLGMGAAHAWGFSFADGLSLMLGFRMVWTGAIWLLNLPVVLFLWRTMSGAGDNRSGEELEEAPH